MEANLPAPPPPALDAGRSPSWPRRLTTFLYLRPRLILLQRSAALDSSSRWKKPQSQTVRHRDDESLLRNSRLTARKMSANKRSMNAR